MKDYLDFLYCHSKNSNKQDPDKLSYAILKFYDIGDFFVCYRICTKTTNSVLWLARFNQRILPLNQSLRDVSIYYLLKALESRVVSLPFLSNLLLLWRFFRYLNRSSLVCPFSLRTASGSWYNFPPSDPEEVPAK